MCYSIARPIGPRMVVASLSYQEVACAVIQGCIHAKPKRARPVPCIAPWRTQRYYLVRTIAESIPPAFTFA